MKNGILIGQVQMAQNVNVAITSLDCATDGGRHPPTFVKQSLTLKKQRHDNEQ